jgi:hypothetical protein
MSTTSIPVLLTQQEVAMALGVSTKLLQYWRAENVGPAFLVLGHSCVRYSAESLREWVKGMEKAGALSTKIPARNSARPFPQQRKAAKIAEVANG